MEAIIRKITDYIVKDTDLDQEVISYGVSAIVSTVLCYSMALFVTSILGNWLFGILFICFLTPIKMQFLGYHCKTMGQCILTYSFSVGLCLIAYNTMIANISILYLILFNVTMGIITYMVRKEINHKNRRILLLYFIVGNSLYYFRLDLFLILCIAVMFNMILVFLRHRQEQYTTE